MILVTGGTGLVGSHLLLELLIAGEKVRAIHRKESDLQAVINVFKYYVPQEEAAFLFDQILWTEASITDIPSLTNAFSGVTRVYHCAALVSFNSKDTAALRKINIEGTANIVNLCIAYKVEKLCYISSIATMDAGIGQKFITEDFTWYPEKDHSEYSISKHGAEIEVWRASQEGIPVVILNPGVVLGPGFWNKGTGQIFKKVNDGLDYHFPKITGFVGVRDVAQIVVKAMNSTIYNEQYILVAENLSFREIFNFIAHNFGKKPPSRPLKPWMVFTGWIFQTVTSFLFGAKKQINKNDYKSLFQNAYYSNTKVIKDFKVEFQPVKKVIEESVAHYKKERSIN